jgi:hypothetical protein
VDSDSFEEESSRQDHLVPPPDADVEDVLGLVGHEMDVYLLVEWDLGNLDFATEEGDAAIGVDQPGSHRQKTSLGEA